MRTSRLAALITLVVVGLVGCRGGGEPPDPPPTPEGVDFDGLDGDDDNGIWRLEGNSALQVVLEAVDEAGPVHIEGAIVELIEQEGADPLLGRAVSMVYDGEPGAFSASIVASDVEVQLVVLDGVGYIRGNEVYAANVGMPELATGFGCVAGSDSIMSAWSRFTDPESLVRLITSDVAVAVSPPTDGGDTAIFVFGEGSPIGTMTVSAQGQPLPSTYTASDASGIGNLSFSGWGEASAIQVPEPLLANCTGL